MQVLIRRANAPDTLPGGYKLGAGQDVMISVYNIHHSPAVRKIFLRSEVYCLCCIYEEFIAESPPLLPKDGK